MSGFEGAQKSREIWFDEDGNEYAAHMPVSYGAFLKEAVKRVNNRKQVYPDLLTPGMQAVVKQLIYSRVEDGGIDAEVYEKDAVLALSDLSRDLGWKRDEDIDIEIVREELLKRLETGEPR